MAKEKTDKESTEVLPAEVNSVISGIAKTLGVATGQLWGIFVRQYFVRGFTELFTGIVLCVAAYFLAPHIHLWILVPLGVAMIFFYGAILLMGNPKYYAIEDITGKIKDFRDEKVHKARW